MKLRFLLVLLACASVASAQLQKTPATRISVSTNGLGVITTNVLQGALVQIDQELTNLQAQVSGGVVTQALALAQAATNTAAQALAIANSSTGAAQRAYVYLRQDDFEILTGTAAQNQFTAGTQSVSRLHVGQAVSNAAVFSAATAITAVDRDTGVVTLDKVLAGNASNATGTFYKADGTYPHITPSGYARCKITVTGGGGGAGVYDGVGAIDIVASGGAGGTAIGYLVMSAGSSNTITAGAGGAFSSGTSCVGTNGGTSSFGSLMSATGGDGGGPVVGGSYYGIGGKGGVALGSSVLITGGAGTHNYCWGSAVGGSSYWGGGSADTNSVYPAYGSGGGGGTFDDSLVPSAFPGAPGIVVVEYY